ncbi:LADA_0H02256g1_1 [Lachancea dasiensis]|uniref:LADA_0H02256g1_1 n=1 Tax=Lachancea dasiensis TaxID=1072105 RepID=A0A1G4JZP7_9SACH|nr:LADA_0H02256g1_1 [Lachancea dasiensis]
MSSEEESKRISVQVSSLSTQLIESIDRQSHLEDQLLQARKTIANQNGALRQIENLEEQVKQLRSNLQTEKAQHLQTQKELQQERIDKDAAQAETSRLNTEVEDLTASLFDEANAMVADARKETHNVSLKNSKLNEQLQEKDTLLETLKIQLKNLKTVLYTLEEESNTVSKSNRNSIAANDLASVSTGSLEGTVNSLTGNSSVANTVLFSPYLKSLRYDLGLYNEFLKFISALPECAAIKDTTSYSKLLRRLIHDEIQPLLRLDTAAGVSWYVRRNLMTLMLEGMVVVEPLSGINETYRLGHSSNPSNGLLKLSKGEKVQDSRLYNYPANSPPVAIQDPCAFCSESRNDILEHGRLYVFKTLQKSDDGSLTLNAQFPLCHYCLLKIRQTCEIFAFLRSLKSGAWHLENVTGSSTPQSGSPEPTEKKLAPRLALQENPALDKKVKRTSVMAGLAKASTAKGTNALGKVPAMAIHSKGPATNIQRAWAQLCKLRASLHWAHMGVWDLEDSLETKLGPVVIKSEKEAAPAIPKEFLTARKHDARDSFTIRSTEDPDNQEFDFEQSDNSDQRIHGSHISIDGSDRAGAEAGQQAPDNTENCERTSNGPGTEGPTLDSIIQHDNIDKENKLPCASSTSDVHSEAKIGDDDNLCDLGKIPSEHGGVQDTTSNPQPAAQPLEISIDSKPQELPETRGDVPVGDFSSDREENSQAGEEIQSIVEPINSNLEHHDHKGADDDDDADFDDALSTMT